MTNIEIAKRAYADIVQGILKFEEDNPEILVGLPQFIDVNGERFSAHKLAMEYLPRLENDR